MQRTKEKNNRKIEILDISTILLIIALIISSFALANDFFQVSTQRQIAPAFSNLIKAKGISSQIWISIKDYADIIVAIISATIATILSITVTIFVFLKSALDRIMDENRYMTDIANIYKSENSKQLFKLCYLSFFMIILSLVWHVLFTFQTSHNVPSTGIGIFSLALALLCSLWISVSFWKKCIDVEKSLQDIICKECIRLKIELNKNPAIKNTKSLILIGDWSQWETDEMDEEDLKNYGEKLCTEMTTDQFINLFSRAETLLMAGEQKNQLQAPHDSEIITAMQERDNILNPNSNIGNQDLKERRYLHKSNDNMYVTDYILEFEKNVGYTRNMKNNRDFFTNTQRLYSILGQYRNLLIAWKYTIAKSTPQKKNSKDRIGHPENNQTQRLFSQGLYFFFLRILSVFVSATHISDFSFNGFTLNFANFYSSTLDHVSLYSSEFYHTIFARAQLIHVVMDISRFDSIDFYNTIISNSTINNAEFSCVSFDGTKASHVGLSSCTFDNCLFDNSDFDNCILNNSEFLSCKFYSVSFAQSMMRDIIWDRVEIKNCNFQNTNIRKWRWNQCFPTFFNCNFSHSLWEQIKIKNGKLSGCDFSKASLSNLTFLDTDFSASIFLECNLSETIIQRCNMNQSSLEKALLFHTEINNCDLKMVNLFQASAIKLKLKNCNLDDSNCADADFSESNFDNTNLHAVRLYDCSLTKTHLSSCIGNYLLADHLQFTFATCDNCDFQNGSFSDSNLTKTVFNSCDFHNSDLTELNATQTEFCNCALVNVDFSGTRFMGTLFRATFTSCRNIKNCNFTDCKFENATFDQSIFDNCIFENTIFIQCKVKMNDGYQQLTKSNFKEIFSMPDKEIMRSLINHIY